MGSAWKKRGGPFKKNVAEAMKNTPGEGRTRKYKVRFIP